MDNRRERFARRLRELRAGARLSLRELGEQVNRDPSSISRWESGQISRIPDADTIAALEDALGVRNVLLEAAGYAPRSENTVDLSLNGQLANLTEREREVARAAIEAAAAQIIRSIRDARGG